MNNYDWRVHSFLEKRTSKPVFYCIVALFIFFISMIVGAYFYKVDQIVRAEGEVIPSAGEREINSPMAGKVINWKVEVGQKVIEGEVLGQIQNFSVSDESLNPAMQLLQSMFDRLSKNPNDVPRIPKEWTIYDKSSNPTVSQSFIDTEASIKKYELTRHELNFDISRKLRILENRKVKIAEKIKTLKRGSARKYLNSIQDELLEQMHKIESEQSGLKEEIHQKLEARRNEMLTQLRASYLTIFNLRESTLIRSTSDGIVAKVLVQNIQTVEKGQTLLTFISDQTSFLVKISVPTSKISKVSPANDVKIAIDSFPFQRYGNFTGKVISVDRLPASDQRDVYFVKSTLIPPRANGGDLATIQLLPGMKATAYIRSRKLSVWQMVFEKVFANEYL